MILVVIGTFSWAVTTLVALRHLIEPWLVRRMILRRFERHERSPRSTLRQLLPALRRAVIKPKPVNQHETLALVLDCMGRELRLGASVHASLLTALSRYPIDELSWLADVARSGGSVRDAARERLESHERPTDHEMAIDFMVRVLIAMTDGADPVHAVESAARTMRASASISADSQAAVAQTLASIRILTWVPIALTVLLAVRDESVREFFLSAEGLICIAAGVALNGLGRHVTARLTTRAVRVRSEIPDFIDMISVHLRAGKPPALAFMQSAEAAGGITGSTARRVVDEVRAGDRFVDALLTHRELFDLRAQPLIDALVDTERDGLPPRELFDRLSDEAKSQRRREADRRLRALPVQLALPLVGCVLPAYVLLAVIPLLVGQFSSVTLDPL